MTIKFRNESAVKKKIKNLLDKHGWFHWMTPANGFGKGGISDHSALKGDKGAGQFMAIEAKHTQTGKGTTALQRDYLFKVDTNGGLAFVVNEKNIGWFEVFLQAYDNAAATFAAAKNEGQDEQACFEAGKEHHVAMLNAQSLLVMGWLDPDADALQPAS